MVAVHEEQQKCIQQQRRLQEKGKTGSNPVEHRKWCVLEFDPQLKANVFFGRFFFDLTRFSSKLDSIGAVFP